MQARRLVGESELDPVRLARAVTQTAAWILVLASCVLRQVPEQSPDPVQMHAIEPVFAMLGFSGDLENGLVC